MPRDGSGNYTLPAGYTAVSGQIVQPAQHNEPLEDIATAITASLPRDGSAGMTGALAMGTNAINNAGLVTATGLNIGAATTASALAQVRAAAGNVVAFDLDVAGGSGTNVALDRRGSDGNLATFYRNSVGVGSISVSASVTAYNTTSDERLKDDFQPIDNSGAIIDALEPLSFLMEYSRSGPRAYGVKAQAAFAVYPYAVTVGSNDLDDADFVPWSVDYSKFVPVLLAEVKALRARVASLEAGA